MLIMWLLHPDPQCRANITSVERNCWVRQNVDITQYKWAEVLPNTGELYMNVMLHCPAGPTEWIGNLMLCL